MSLKRIDQAVPEAGRARFCFLKKEPDMEQTEVDDRRPSTAVTTGSGDRSTCPVIDLTAPTSDVTGGIRATPTRSWCTPSSRGSAASWARTRLGRPTSATSAGSATACPNQATCSSAWGAPSPPRDTRQYRVACHGSRCAVRYVRVPRLWLLGRVAGDSRARGHQITGHPDAGRVSRVVAQRIARGLNHGRRSRKFIQDCTICHLLPLACI